MAKRKLRKRDHVNSLWRQAVAEDKRGNTRAAEARLAKKFHMPVLSMTQPLIHSLHAGHDRQVNARRTGLTDEQIREFVSREYGISGGSSGPGYRYAYRGGSNPAF